MVKISASGYEDGEGPSNPTQKRRRVEENNQNQSQPQQQFEEGYEMEYPPLGSPNQNHSNHGNEEIVGSSSNDRGKNAISAIISDPDVLECFICCEPLNPPVFQCENGHIACSCCCTKITNKCPLCLMPIGYLRCRAIEKMLESIRVSCSNIIYGCEEVVSFSMKNHHEKQCGYMPCLCPRENCDFVASSKKLALHFSHIHVGFGVQFPYDKFFSIFLHKDQKTFVLRDKKDDRLFVVHNNVVSLGNAVTIICLGPASMVGFHYDVLTRSQGSTLILQSSTKIIQGDHTTDAPTVEFLLIPSNNFGSAQFKLDIRIKSR